MTTGENILIQAVSWAGLRRGSQRAAQRLAPAFVERGDRVSVTITVMIDPLESKGAVAIRRIQSK